MARNIRVGDIVWFKSDVEQRGRVVAIERNVFGEQSLRLESLDASGFSGDYIGGRLQTTVDADRCELV